MSCLNYLKKKVANTKIYGFILQSKMGRSEIDTWNTILYAFAWLWLLTLLGWTFEEFFLPYTRSALWKSERKCGIQRQTSFLTPNASWNIFWMVIPETPNDVAVPRYVLMIFEDKLSHSNEVIFSEGRFWTSFTRFVTKPGISTLEF